MACAAKLGFAIINAPTSDAAAEEGTESTKATLAYLAQPLPADQVPYTRFNDGACDARGRFLAGTLESTADGHSFPGSLWRYDPADGSCVLLDEEEITVRQMQIHFPNLRSLLLHQDSNGLGWSEDNKTMYVYHRFDERS